MPLFLFLHRNRLLIKILGWIVRISIFFHAYFYIFDEISIFENAYFYIFGEISDFWRKDGAYFYISLLEWTQKKEDAHEAHPP
jgi:hypothetical protein